MMLDKFKNKKKDKSQTPSEGYKNRKNKNICNANRAFNLYFRYLGNTS